MSALHSGHPYQFDVDDTATMGDIGRKVVELNNEWFRKGWSQNRFQKVRICSSNGYYDDNACVSTWKNKHDNECYLVFDAMTI